MSHFKGRRNYSLFETTDKMGVEFGPWQNAPEAPLKFTDFSPKKFLPN